MSGPSVGADTGLAGVEIVIEDAVDDETAQSYYELYRTTFGPLQTQAVSRQVLHEDEFLAEMRDPRVMKYVARDTDGRAIGMSTLTKDLETVPWISPTYFAHHYPDHTARDAVFYLGFTLVHPGRRQAQVFQAMVAQMIERVLAERGVCGWDICAYNEATIGFSAGIERFVLAHADADITAVDTQTYFAAVLHGPVGR